MSSVEDQLKEKIDELIRQKAESSSDEPSDFDHGYVDALIWLKEGSIPLSDEGLRKEIAQRTYADAGAGKEYCEGYDNALKQVKKILSELKK
jgi:hypothetical protein